MVNNTLLYKEQKTKTSYHIRELISLQYTTRPIRKLRLHFKSMYPPIMKWRCCQHNKESNLVQKPRTVLFLNKLYILVQIDSVINRDTHFFTVKYKSCTMRSCKWRLVSFTKYLYNCISRDYIVLYFFNV